MPLRQSSLVFEEPLRRVVRHVEYSIEELSRLRLQEYKWQNAFQAVRRIALSPRKHLIRPRLVLLGYGKESNEGVEKFAAGVELQHLFMFVHDDLMDHAFTRRGVDTIQVAIAARSAKDRMRLHPETVQHLTTLVGDVLQAKSFALLHEGEQLTGSSNHATLAILEGAFRAGAAQFDDILGWAGVEQELEASTACTHETLLRRLLYDKASHNSFAAPLIAGMRLGHITGLEPQVTQWASHCGAAYQAMDDVLALILDPIESGKDKLQDVQEGRLSLPLFLLRRLASSDEWDLVLNILGTFDMSPSERNEMMNLIEKHRLPDVALDFANDEISKARDHLVNFESEDLRNGLHELLDQMVQQSTELRAKIERP